MAVPTQEKAAQLLLIDNAGQDAIGEVQIRIESAGITYTGRGADTDIIVASAKAYINALNRLLAAKKAAG